MGLASEAEVNVGWRDRLTNFRPHRRAVIGWIVYLIVLGVYITFWGIPFTEDTLLLWITGAVFVSCLGEPARFRRGFIRDWFPLYVVLGLYALLRGYADHLLFNTHITPQLRFDNWIGGGVSPTVRLQQHFFDAYHLHLWDYLAWGTYLSHFFLSFLICGVLWVRDHKAFRRFVALYVTLMLSGFLTYVLYPAMPPWLASQLGYMPGSVRIVPVVWSSLGIHWAAALFESGHRFNNDVAAVPSLHAALPLLICLFFFPRTKRVWVKVLLVLYVPAMATALVYTGEHYVFDILLGWLYATVVYFGGSWVLDRLDDRKAARLQAAEARAAASSDGAGPSGPGSEGSAAGSEPDPARPAVTVD